MWHIQKDIFGQEEEGKLKDALDRANILHCDCVGDQVVKSPKGWMQDTSTPVFRGSLEFIQPMRHKYINAFRKNVPSGVTLSGYLCSRYYPPWLDWMLNRDHFFVSWGTLKKDAQQYFKWLNSDRLFIRPNSGKKIFTGNYISKKWWPQDLLCIESLAGSIPDNDEIILVSSYKEVYSEYRALMYRGEMITCSYYSGYEWKTEGVEYSIKEFCRTASYYAKYLPDDYYTLDICIHENGSMNIIEINSLFAAGWYDCDYDKMVKHISETYNVKVR